VRRIWQPEEATKRFKKAISDAFESHKTRAPKELREVWRQRLFEEMSARETIEPEEDFDKFGASVFGPFFQDQEFRKEISKRLHAQRISDEVIELSPNALRKPKIRKIQTVEDIEIRFPTFLETEHIIEVTEVGEGWSEIKIRTQGIKENELVDEIVTRGGR
jgi:plasmid rolling circle replication initiator protein Rep